MVTLATKACQTSAVSSMPLGPTSSRPFCPRPPSWRPLPGNPSVWRPPPSLRPPPGDPPPVRPGQWGGQTVFKSRLKQCFRKVKNLQIPVRPGPGGGQPTAVFFTLVTSKTLFFTLRPGRRGGQAMHARSSVHCFLPYGRARGGVKQCFLKVV